MGPRRSQPVRITTAPPSHADDIAGRQRRYLISMGIRTLCVIGAVAVGPGVLRWVLAAGAILLPYVAVVAANARDNRADPFALVPGPWQRELRPPEKPDEDLR